MINFVRKISNLGYVEAVKQLAGRAGMPMPEEDDQESRSRSRLLEINRNAARYFYDQLNAPTPEAAMARRYWREKSRPFGCGHPPVWPGLCTGRFCRPSALSAPPRLYRAGIGILRPCQA